VTSGVCYSLPGDMQSYKTCHHLVSFVNLTKLDVSCFLKVEQYVDRTHKPCEHSVVKANRTNYATILSNQVMTTFSDIKETQNIIKLVSRISTWKNRNKREILHFVGRVANVLFESFDQEDEDH